MIAIREFGFITLPPKKAISIYIHYINPGLNLLTKMVILCHVIFYTMRHRERDGDGEREKQMETKIRRVWEEEREAKVLKI